MTDVKQIAIPTSVVFKKVGDELVLLDFERGVYYGLNEVGGRMWEVLSSGGSSAQAIDAIVAEYDVDRDRVARDLDLLLDDLVANGLIEYVQES